MDLAGSLVTSSRLPGRLQKRPDDRTSNASVTVRIADGSRRTTDAADEQCLMCECSSHELWCFVLQTSMDHCKQLVLHPLRNAQPAQLIMPEIGESAVILLHVTDYTSGSIQYSLELVYVGLGAPVRMALNNLGDPDPRLT